MQEVHTENVNIIKTGVITNLEYDYESPYADINYHGREKQLIFHANENPENKKTITLKIRKGFLGFDVIAEKKAW